MAQRRFRILVKWTDPKWGPQTEKLAAEGTSARRAINNALLGFFSDASRRKERRAAHQQVTVEAWRIDERRKQKNSGAAHAASKQTTRKK
jgi:hypothetical protein